MITKKGILKGKETIVCIDGAKISYKALNFACEFMRGFSKILLGSISEKVLSNSDKVILIYKNLIGEEHYERKKSCL